MIKRQAPVRQSGNIRLPLLLLALLSTSAEAVTSEGFTLAPAEQAAVSRGARVFTGHICADFDAQRITLSPSVEASRKVLARELFGDQYVTQLEQNNRYFLKKKQGTPSFVEDYFARNSVYLRTTTASVQGRDYLMFIGCALK